MVLCTDLIGLHLDKLAPSCPNVTLLLSHTLYQNKFDIISLCASFSEYF